MRTPHLSVFLLFTASTVWAEEPRPVAGRQERAVAPSWAHLELVPRDVGNWVWIPRLSAALAALDEGLALAGQVEPEWSQNTSLGLLAGLLTERPVPALQTAALAEAGVDPHGAVLLMERSPVWLVVVPLLNPEQFVAALESLDRTQPLTFGQQRALVVGPQSPHPIICVIGASRALCQLGESPGADPLAGLKAAVSARRTPAELERLARPLRSHGDEARLVIRFDVQARVDAEVQRWLAEIERTHRFEKSSTKKQRLHAAQKKAAEIRRYGQWIEAGSAALFKDPEGLRAAILLDLLPSGSKALAGVLASGGDERLARWADTPALLRVVSQVNPLVLQQWLGEWLPFPEGSFTGAWAALVLGHDAECAQAKKLQAQAKAQGQLDWAFLFPSAIAMGLAPGRADAVHQTLAQTLAPSGEGARPALSGQTHGSPFQVRILEDVMFVATGPGSGAAAERKWHAVPATRRPRIAPPFLSASLSLRAVDAALASSSASDLRSELVALQLLRLKVKPLVEQLDRLELELSTPRNHQHVRAELRALR